MNESREGYPLIEVCDEKMIPIIRSAVGCEVRRSVKIEEAKRNSLRVVYVALDPFKYPRIKKIAHSLGGFEGVKFNIMVPRFRFIYRGGKVGRLFFAFLNYFAALLQIFCVQADVFWVANCPDVLAFPLILRRKSYILEYRSPWAVEVEHEFGGGPWVRFAAFSEHFVLKYAWIVTLTTSRLSERVKNFRKPTFVIPNYPLESFGRITVSKGEFRRRYVYSEGDRVVLFVGKLTHVEGADLLPKIITDVLRKRNDVTFWIVGDGPYYESLKNFAEKFHGKVKMFGWQPHENIPNFIAASDVCIAPRHKSIYSDFYNEEGVSKLSEYMFFEKPIVACGVAESSEYLLVDEDKMADGVLKALQGEIHEPKRRTWEEHSERKIY
ncbi:MAG: glycosyltransferase, partial [Candidatus Bathycorpusculaceae bacterium]